MNKKTDMEQLVKNVMKRAENHKWEKKLNTIIEEFSKIDIKKSDEMDTINLIYDEESGSIQMVRGKKK